MIVLMQNYIVTYQPHYRTNSKTCIVSIPASFSGDSQEFLEEVQRQCQEHAWDSALYFHQDSKENYANMPIINIFRLENIDCTI